MNTKSRYWDEEKMVENCRKWQNATSEREYQLIYNNMILSFNKMSDIIRQRYFSFRYDEHSELRTRCITACFTSISKYNFKYKAFSYFQTVIKNTLLEIVRVKNVYEKRFDRVIDNDELGDSNAILIDNNINYFNTKKHLIDTMSSIKCLSKVSEIIRDEMIMFIENHDMKNLRDMLLYLIKLGYKNKDIVKTTSYLFGINIKTIQPDSNKNYDNIAIDDYYNDKISINDMKDYRKELIKKNKYISKYDK